MNASQQYTKGKLNRREPSLVDLQYKTNVHHRNGKISPWKGSADRQNPELCFLKQTFTSYLVYYDIEKWVSKNESKNKPRKKNKKRPWFAKVQELNTNCCHMIYFIKVRQMQKRRTRLQQRKNTLHNSKWQQWAISLIMFCEPAGADKWWISKYVISLGTSQQMTPETMIQHSTPTGQHSRRSLCFHSSFFSLWKTWPSAATQFTLTPDVPFFSLACICQRTKTHTRNRAKTPRGEDIFLSFFFQEQGGKYFCLLQQLMLNLGPQLPLHGFY